MCDRLPRMSSNLLFVILTAGIFFTLFGCFERKDQNKIESEPSLIPEVEKRDLQSKDEEETTKIFEINTLIKYGHFADALELITNQLRSNSANEKLLSLRTELFLLAGQPELAALSNDEHARLLGIHQADELLRGLLHENAEVRANAILALDISEDPRRFEAVMPIAVVDGAVTVRIAAMRLLRKSRDNRLKNTFLALAKDESWIIRSEALDALTEWNDTETRRIFWASANDEEPLVRHRARTALIKFLNEETHEEYLKMATGANIQIAFAAALAFAQSGDPEAKEALIRALNQEEDRMLRQDAARALAMIPPPPTEEILGALHNALDGEDSQLRSVIIDTLEKYQDVRSIDVLAQMSNNPLVPAVLSRRMFDLLQELRNKKARILIEQQMKASDIVQGSGSATSRATVESTPTPTED